MISILNFIAQATTPSAPSGGQAPPSILQFIQSFGWLIILLVVLWFVTIRSKQKEQKTREQMLNELKKNDRVETIGGVLGTIVEVRDGEVLVKVDETNNTKMRFRRSAIHRVVVEEDKK